MCGVFQSISAVQQRKNWMRSKLLYFHLFLLDGTAALSVVLEQPPWRTCTACASSSQARKVLSPLKHANSTTLNKALTHGRLDGGPTHTFAFLWREIVGHLVARVPLQWSSFGLQEVLNVIVLSISHYLDFSKRKSPTQSLNNNNNKTRITVWGG